MPFSEAVAVALSSLRANKLRSFLTVLGILIGVSAVVAVVAIIEGLDRYVAGKVMSLGTKSFRVQKMPDVVLDPDTWLEMFRRKNITLLDLEAVRRACTACSEVGGGLFTVRNVKWGRTTRNDVQVMGITENWPRIGSLRDLIAGRHLVQDDVERAAPVGVIGADLKEAFFGEMEPIGKAVFVGPYAVKVVGVAEPKGSFFGRSQDNFVWIPITTFQKFYGSRRSVAIQAEAATIGDLEEAQDQARMALRIRRHLSYGKPDDFNVETGESIMNLWNNFTRGIYVVTIVVTAMSLVIGGIVVMNIMLVSVTERIKEIGIRKALGARRRDILRQFLVEAVVLSVFGGLLGVAGATLFSTGLGAVLGAIMKADFAAPVRLWAVALAFAVSTAVGLVAGIYPASRAASLDPVEALRSE
jgi:putative ABC transport system permease protein